jgi:hypothetical protein
MSGPAPAEAQSDAPEHVHSATCGHLNLAAEHIHSGGCCGTDPSLGISATSEMATDGEWDAAMTLSSDVGAVSTLLPGEVFSVTADGAVGPIASVSATTTMAGGDGPPLIINAQTAMEANAHVAIEAPVSTTFSGHSRAALGAVEGTQGSVGLHSSSAISSSPGGSSAPMRNAESEVRGGHSQADSRTESTWRMETNSGWNRAEVSRSGVERRAQSFHIEAGQQRAAPSQDVTLASPSGGTTRFMGWAADRKDEGVIRTTQTVDTRLSAQERSGVLADPQRSTRDVFTSAEKGPHGTISREVSVPQKASETSESRLGGNREKTESWATVSQDRRQGAVTTEVVRPTDRGNNVRETQGSERRIVAERGIRSDDTLRSAEAARRRSPDTLTGRGETPAAATRRDAYQEHRGPAVRGTSDGVNHGRVGRVSAQRDAQSRDERPLATPSLRKVGGEAQRDVGRVQGVERGSRKTGQGEAPRVFEKVMQRGSGRESELRVKTYRSERMTAATGSADGTIKQLAGKPGMKRDAQPAVDRVPNGAQSLRRAERQVSRSAGKVPAVPVDVDKGGKGTARQRPEAFGRRDDARDVLGGRPGNRDVQPSRVRGGRERAGELPVGTAVVQRDGGRISREISKPVTRGGYTEARMGRDVTGVPAVMGKEKGLVRSGGMRPSESLQSREVPRLRRDIGRVRADLLLRAQQILSVSRLRSHTRGGSGLAPDEQALAHLLRLRLAAEILEALEGDEESLDGAASRVAVRRSPRLRLRTRKIKKLKANDAEVERKRAKRLGKAGRSAKNKVSKAGASTVTAAKSQTIATSAATGQNSLKTGPSKSLDIFQLKAEDSVPSSEEQGRPADEFA